MKKLSSNTNNYSIANPINAKAMDLEKKQKKKKNAITPRGKQQHLLSVRW